MIKGQEAQSKGKRSPTKMLRALDQRISDPFIFWSWIWDPIFFFNKKVLGPQSKFNTLYIYFVRRLSKC